MKKTVIRAAALGCLLLAILVTANHYYDVAAAPSEISSANSPSWTTPAPGIEISDNTGVGANEPSIAVSPSGKLIIVYNNWMTSSNDRDPYYSVSANGGNSWSNPAPIFSSPGDNSIQVDVAYDSNEIAHAVWVELQDGPGPLKTAILYYSRYNGSTWTAPSTLSSVVSTLPVVNHPRIVASGGYIDVVWEEGSPTIIESGGNAAILHRRSSNGGQNWSSTVQISDQTTAPAVTADVEIGAGGEPHAVWRKSLPGGDSTIRYTEAIVLTGNQVAWQSPITVSGSISNTNQPELLVKNGRVHTSFTQSVISGLDSFDQWVYYTFCDQGCMSTANWSPPFNTIVDPVEVNDNSPFDVISDVVNGSNNCTYIFFHGLRDDTFGRELVWNVNSCDGWNPPEGWDPVTNDDTRAIYPRSVSYGGILLLTFQIVDEVGRNSIYFMKGSFGPGGGFLPIVLKN